MIKIIAHNEIDRAEWERLVQTSATGTWFQSPGAYNFFASMPELFYPFAFGIENKGSLRGVCCGYVTVEKNALKQFMTRRAIIIGGPCFADDCTDEEVRTLMEAVREQPILNPFLKERTSNRSSLQGRVGKRLLSPIYIETRNFNSYAQWKEAFERAGFEYKKHLNFHVDSTNEEAMWERLSENRRRQIRKGESVIEIIENKNKENTAEAEKNIKKQEIKNTHSTSALLYGLHGLECNQPQTPTNELAAFVDANTPNLLPNSSTLNASKNATPSYENTKNNEDILEWYGILERLYRRKVKTPLWPVEFFMEAYRHGVGKFLLVKHEGKVIGGSMVVTDAKCVYEWFECGLNAECKEQYPSVMATWAGMHYAHETGCARYDMMGAGAPGVPYGVRDFKSEFGGELVEHGRFLCICKPWLYKIGKLGVNLLKKNLIYASS